MSLHKEKDSFEEFRREKRMRSLHRELRSRMESRQGQIMRMIDEKERDELLEKQIQREMDDFFEESTKLAAEILGELAREKAREVAARINREMREFFQDVLNQARSTVTTIQANPGGMAQRTLETHMDPDLLNDFGGHATGDEDSGESVPEPPGLEEPPAGEVREEDPPEEQEPEEALFIPEPEGSREETVPGAAEEESETGEEEPEAAIGEEDLDEVEPPPDPEASAQELIRNLSSEPTKLKKALTALYQAGVIDREEARTIYLAKRQETVGG